MTTYPGYQRPLCRDRPTLDVGFEEIGVIANEVGCGLVASVGKF
jgi:hypothetical protein